jgi:hypothetical protein
MLNNPEIGDTVRYSRSAIRTYGLTKEARQRTAMVVVVHDGYVTINWDGKGGYRNIPNWALDLVQSYASLDSRIAAAERRMGC